MGADGKQTPRDREKPTEYGLIEAFNGRLRTKCLNTSWFISMPGSASKNEGSTTTPNEPTWPLAT
jgi:hypothetical protein